MKYIKNEKYNFFVMIVIYIGSRIVVVGDVLNLIRKKCTVVIINESYTFM